MEKLIIEIAFQVIRELISLGFERLKNENGLDSALTVTIERGEITEEIENRLEKAKSNERFNLSIDRIFDEIQDLSRRIDSLEMSPNRSAVLTLSKGKYGNSATVIEKNLSELESQRLNELLKSKSKRMLENLHEYEEKGELIRQKIKSLDLDSSAKNGILDDSKIKDCLKSLEDAAESTVQSASSTVKIAVMGAISSGKTLLIANLIGRVNALPVGPLPTTGNITALKLIQQRDFKRTSFENPTVKYFSQEEVRLCLEFMLKEIQKQMKKVGLSSAPVGNLDRLDKDTLKHCEDWCEQLWNQAHNPGLRSRLRELVVFIRTYDAYGEDLCGETRKITEEDYIPKGLELTDADQQLEDFGDIPSVPKQHIGKEGLSQKLLQDSFSLIRRIEIDVKISKEFWDLEATPDSGKPKFILLDFPGLDAADSGLRDAFVTKQELYEEVHTILILLNGKGPKGSDHVNMLYDMIEQIRPREDPKDFTLVGLSQFNELLSIENEQRLEELIRSDICHSLTDEAVLSELSELDNVMNQALHLSREDCIVFLDQIIGLRYLTKSSSGVNIGSLSLKDLPSFDDQDSSVMQKSKKMRDMWNNLSDCLLAKDNRSFLGGRLDDFAQDGGIDKLKELISKHVATQGLKRLYEETRENAMKLRQQQNSLNQLLSSSGIGISSEESSALVDLRTNLETMKNVFSRFKDDLGKEPLQDKRGVPIDNVIKDEVTFRVFEWSEWYSLFNYSKGGIIVAPQKGNQEPAYRRINRLDDNNIPTKSDDFFGVFKRTFEGLKEFADDCIKDAIDNLFQKLYKDLDKEMEFFRKKKSIYDKKMGEIEDESNENDRYSELRKGCKNLEGFYTLYDVRTLREGFIGQVFQESVAVYSEEIFPLAIRDEKHRIGQIFDWAPEYGKNKKQKPNHILLVQRLRDEIITTISLHIIEYAGEMSRKVDAEIEAISNRIIPVIGDLLKHGELLSFMTGESQEIDRGDSVVSHILSDIARISISDERIK